MENTYYVEMPADYRELTDAYYHQFAPEGPIERSLVDSLAYDVWLRNRVLDFKTSYSYDPERPGLNQLLEIATRRLPVLERRCVQSLKCLQKEQRRRTRASKPAKLASFRHPVPRAAGPKTSTGEWIN